MIFWIFVGSAALVCVLLGLASLLDKRAPAAADFFGGAAVIPLATGVLSVLAFLVGMLAGAVSSEDTSTPSCERELSALSTGRASEIGGSTFLGIGSVSGGDYRTITYVERAADGSMQLLEKPASKSRIFEDAPEGEGWVECSYRPVKFYGGIVAPWWHEVTTDYYITGYEFHVPEGSVSTSFEVTP